MTPEAIKAQNLWPAGFLPLPHPHHEAGGMIFRSSSSTRPSDRPSATSRGSTSTSIADGPIKTFPLRGIKDSPPYLHDDRLLTLDDTVEFFDLVLGLKLLSQEKKDIVAFMRAL